MQFLQQQQQQRQQQQQQLLQNEADHVLPPPAKRQRIPPIVVTEQPTQQQSVEAGEIRVALPLIFAAPTEIPTTALPAMPALGLPQFEHNFFSTPASNDFARPAPAISPSSAQEKPKMPICIHCNLPSSWKHDKRRFWCKNCRRSFTPLGPVVPGDKRHHKIPGPKPKRVNQHQMEFQQHFMSDPLPAVPLPAQQAAHSELKARLKNKADKQAQPSSVRYILNPPFTFQDTSQTDHSSNGPIAVSIPGVQCTDGWCEGDIEV